MRISALRTMSLRSTRIRSRKLVFASVAWVCARTASSNDFGLKPLRAPQDEDFHDLVAERYEQGATIVTSNLDFSEWGDAFPNRLLGAATLDRLRHGAYRLTLEGESYRSPRPIPERRKSTVATGGKPKK